MEAVQRFAGEQIALARLTDNLVDIFFLVCFNRQLRKTPSHTFIYSIIFISLAILTCTCIGIIFIIIIIQALRSIGIHINDYLLTWFLSLNSDVHSASCL